MGEIVYQKCPDNKELLNDISSGKVDDMIVELMPIFAHINYKYDTLSYLLTNKITKIEGKPKNYYYHLYEITHYFKYIQINIGYIPQSEYRPIYLKEFEEIFIKIYKYIKIRCKQVVKNDILYVMTLTRKHFIKRIKYHPFITSDRSNIPYYD